MERTFEPWRRAMIPAAISDNLDRNHARYSVLSHPTAYSVQEEAAAAQIPGGEWAKTVVCVADGQPIVAVVPAPFAATRREKPSPAPTVGGRGGVAATDADTEDVTRDPYGFPSPPSEPPNPQQRVANAEREVEQVGTPGGGDAQIGSGNQG